MIVVGVSPREDYKTITGLRMRVEFEQIFMASTMLSGATAASQPALNVRPDTAAPAGLGQVNTSSVSSTTQQQFAQPQPIKGFYNADGSQAYYAPDTSAAVANAINVPGAGSYSSTPGQQALP
jgi:hypothetical protein